ncbi:MAG: hypothetical protein HDS67_01865 [Bacteroidales bacterium]|nr:hypothetical protein [Bacteroidales bacterium]
MRFEAIRRLVATGLLTTVLLCGCDSVDDSVIPSMPVAINLGDAGMWNTYGVAGFGQSRRFINYKSTLEPAGFPFTGRTYTGYGGVLLISGIDAFTNEPGALAYDLSCPIERSQTVRVAVDPESLEAVCPVCLSHYDVTMRGGAPLSGPAAAGKRKYGLRRYTCLKTTTGGYMITN